MQRTALILIIGSIVVLALTLVNFYQGGGLLQTRIYPGASPSEIDATDPSLLDNEVSDTQETYCQNIKQSHIADCGQQHPEADHHCRTEEAEAVYQQCLQEYVEETLDDSDSESLLGEDLDTPAYELP